MWPILVLLSFSPSPTKPTQEAPALTYNNVIITKWNEVVSLNLEYLVAGLMEEDYDKMEAKRKAIIAAIDVLTTDIQKLGSFEGDASFQQEALKYFSTCRNVFELELKTVNELKAPSISDYKSLQLYFSNLEKAENAMINQGEKLRQVQEAFAKGHSLIIQENETHRAIKSYMNASRHNRQITLITFKVHYINNDFIKALNQNDFDKMQATADEINREAPIALNTLEALPTLGADKPLRTKANELIKYCQLMAGSHYKRLVVLLQEKALTQKQADEANNILNGMNKSGPQKINAYNQAQMDYLAKYIPKN